MDESSRERLVSREHYRAIVLNNPLVLFPHWTEWNYRIPFADGLAVGQIAQNHVDSLAWNVSQYFQAIPLKYLIYECVPFSCYLISSYSTAHWNTSGKRKKHPRRGMLFS